MISRPWIISASIARTQRRTFGPFYQFRRLTEKKPSSHPFTKTLQPRSLSPSRSWTWPSSSVRASPRPNNTPSPSFFPALLPLSRPLSRPLCSITAIIPSLGVYRLSSLFPFFLSFFLRTVFLRTVFLPYCLFVCIHTFPSSVRWSEDRIG